MREQADRKRNDDGMQERQRDRESESQRVRVERKQRRWSGEKGEKMDEDDRPWDKTRRRVEQERKGVRVLDRQMAVQFCWKQAALAVGLMHRRAWPRRTRTRTSLLGICTGGRGLDTGHPLPSISKPAPRMQVLLLPSSQKMGFHNLIKLSQSQSQRAAGKF